MTVIDRHLPPDVFGEGPEGGFRVLNSPPLPRAGTQLCRKTQFRCFSRCPKLLTPISTTMLTFLARR
jgi:hypothetical protein